MTQRAVGLELDGPVGVVRLQRPEVHNVVDEQVMSELEDGLDRLDRSPDVRVVILTGSGSATFSAGGDLRYFASLSSRGAAQEMSERMQRIVARFADGPRVLIAAASGNAWGGGCELLVACHLRLASERAKFQFRQASLGVVTGWGGGYRLFQILGPDQALRLLLTAEVIDAQEALRIGLVHRLTEPHQVESEARKLAQKVAEYPRAAVAAFMELGRIHGNVHPDEFRARESEVFADLWVEGAFRQKLEEFLKKEGNRKRGIEN